MNANTTAEGHQIIAEHRVNGSLIFITRQANRQTGADLYVVNVNHVGRSYITWSQHDSEASARQSANRAWLRFAGRETMIAA